MNHMPALQPKRFGEGKKILAGVGFFLLGAMWWGRSWCWYQRTLCGEGRALLRDYPALFQMLLRGHRDNEDFSQVIQHITSIEKQIFDSRSTDLASTSQFTCCVLPCRSPAEISATSCNESTHLGISAICFCLLSLSSLLLLFQCAKMLHIQKGNHCWIQAAQPPFASSSLQANH